jgi:hypothetical protein
MMKDTMFSFAVSTKGGSVELPLVDQALIPNKRVKPISLLEVDGMAQLYWRDGLPKHCSGSEA